MKLLNLENNGSIILRYVATGIVGISFGALILILIYILSNLFFGFIRYLLFDAYSFFSFTIMTTFSAAFFGIVSKDFRKLLHYGLAGFAVGILIVKLFGTYGVSYFHPLIIMSFWGFAIGLPKIKSAIHSALAGMAGGAVIALIAYIAISQPFKGNVFLLPAYVIFSFLVVGTIIGLIAYVAEKSKDIKPVFNDTLLITGFTFGIGGLIVVTVILTAILALVSAL